MEEMYDETISGNTADPQPEEPDIESGDADDEENQESDGDGGTSQDGSEESGSGDETGDSENTGSAPSDSESDSAVEDVGGTDSPTDVGASPDDFRQAVDGLNAVAEILSEGTPDYGDLLESVRSLVDIMTVQVQSVQSNIIPINGYRDYDYPITVTWEVHPSAPNAPSRMENTESFDTPEAFEVRYEAMCDMVGVSLNSFRILRIRDCSDLDYVYDADRVTEEPEMPEEPEEPEESGTFQEDVLAALSTLHEDLQSISMNDLEYHEQYTALQEQYTQMQEQNTDLQYHMLASNIAIGFALLLTLGYTVAHGFLQRMKVG